jgi:hypothetical protein
MDLWSKAHGNCIPPALVRLDDVSTESGVAYVGEQKAAVST